MVFSRQLNHCYSRRQALLKKRIHSNTLWVWKRVPRHYVWQLSKDFQFHARQQSAINHQPFRWVECLQILSWTSTGLWHWGLPIPNLHGKLSDPAPQCKRKYSLAPYSKKQPNVIQSKGSHNSAWEAKWKRKIRHPICYSRAWLHIQASVQDPPVDMSPRLHWNDQRTRERTRSVPREDRRAHHTKKVSQKWIKAHSCLLHWCIQVRQKFVWVMQG